MNRKNEETLRILRDDDLSTAHGAADVCTTIDGLYEDAVVSGHTGWINFFYAARRGASCDAEVD